MLPPPAAMIDRRNALTFLWRKVRSSWTVWMYSRFSQIPLQHHVWCVKNTYFTGVNLCPLRKIFASTLLPSWLRSCFRYFIMKLWTERGVKSFILILTKNCVFYDNFSVRNTFCTYRFKHFMVYRRYVHIHALQKTNPLSVCVFSDTKSMRRVKCKCGIHSPCINLACVL